MAAAVVVTGLKELDSKLQNMVPALQRKLVRKALRKSGYRVAKEFKRVVRAEAHDTGALERSIKVQSLPRSRSRIGIGAYVDRNKLFANYADGHDGKTPHPAAGSGEPFYYAAVIEFGDKHHKPIRPQRRALYDHAAEYVRYFVSDLLEWIKESKVNPKAAGQKTNSQLREDAKRAGQAAYRDVSGRLQKTSGGFVSLANARALGYTGK